MNRDWEVRTVRKALVRLLPLLLAAYLTSYLNRVNIGFAPTLSSDLGFSAEMFGLGAGFFFIGYFIFEVPSNLLLAKFGARRWIARIMLSWGLLSMAMALVSGTTSFLVLRFLIGVAEAGFFPGVILYITYWFPAAYRSRTTALFMAAIPISLAMSGPLSNMITAATADLTMLRPWQWLFILEGIPTVLLAFAVLTWLPDRPRDAKWLSENEKIWLESTLSAEARQIHDGNGPGLFKTFTDPRVLALAFIYFANITTNLGIAFFLPQIIKSQGVSDVAANYISSIPFVLGMIGVLLFGVLADRFRAHRKALLVLSLGISAAGLAGAGLAGATYASIVLIALASIGIYGAKGPFWPLPSMFLTGSAAAGGIALINSVGNLGGFVGPYMIGYVKTATGSYVSALYMLAGFAVAAAVVSLMLRSPSTIEVDGTAAVRASKSGNS